MLRSKASRWIALGLLGALLVAAGTAVAQDRGEGRRRRDGDGPRDRRAAAARWLRHRAEARRGKALLRLQRLMDATDEQAKAALEASREAARVREEAKSKAAAIVVQAFREAKDATPERRAQIRTETRQKLRALKEGARAPLAEAGRKVLASLTPEQRKRMDEALKDRGLSFDDEHLALHFGKRIAHPWAEALLKARLESK